MRTFALSLFILFLTSLFFSATAAPCEPEGGVACLGKECAVIGTTKLDFGQKNIIACLYNDAWEKKWKSTSISDEIFTCPPGQMLVKVEDGSPVCGNLDYLKVSAPTASCGTYDPPDNGNPSVAQCPSGYTLSGGGYMIDSWNPATGSTTNSPDASWPFSSTEFRVVAGAKAGNSCFRAYAVCLRVQ